jgi:Kef-type K+ transport system membrane component KefB
MRKKDIILLIIIILLGVTGSFIENQSIQTLLIAGIFILIIITKLTDYIYRKKLIKQINSENMNYIKVK